MSTLQDKTALDGRSGQEAESLVSEIQAKAGRAQAISADLGTPNGAAVVAKQVRAIVGDRLDVLVLNAGISKAARLADYTVEDFDNLFATNVRGPFFLVQQLLPILGDGSNIIVISSLGARTVVGKPGLDNPSLLAYASTKGALETLVKNWAAIPIQNRDDSSLRNRTKCFFRSSSTAGRTNPRIVESVFSCSEPAASSPNCFLICFESFPPLICVTT